MMVHQPNSLDSLDGEAALPFDPVPVRYESSPGDPGGLLPRIDEQTNIFNMKWRIFARISQYLRPVLPSVDKI